MATVHTNPAKVNHEKLIVAAAAAGLRSLALPLAAQAQTSPAEAQVTGLKRLSGKQAGFRRSQTKGVCASCYFVGNAAGAICRRLRFQCDSVTV